jgi:Xaa-Pro aminopeptidase
MMHLLSIGIALSLSVGAGVLAQRPAGAQATPTYAQRIAKAYDRLGKDVLIVRSAWTPASSIAARFDQASSFFYFTGAESLLGGVLVLDGAARRAELFLPRELPGGLKAVAPNQPAPGAATPASLHVDAVSDWSAFAPYIDRRLAADPGLIIRVDDGGFDAGLAGRLGTPFDSLFTLGNPNRAWRRAVQQQWSKADVRSDFEIMGGLRAIKEPGEIAALRRVAASSAAAFLDGLGQFSAGRRQRHVEAAIVAACLRSGNGPSFWPWVMSGLNAAFPTPFTAGLDNRNLDRTMLAGEIVRLDLGCQVDHYMGDVGRTVPVSGTFSAEQREVIDLLVAAYRAGLAVIRDGATTAGVIAASVGEVARRQSLLRTALGKEAAAVITRRDGIPYWQIHGIGLEAAEWLPDTLRAGMVLDYEPIFVAGGNGFYMEDMILVTRSGYEILTKGLPSSAAEIERAMRSAASRSPR